MKEPWQPGAALCCDQYEELPPRLKQTVLAFPPLLCSSVVFHGEPVLSISQTETFFFFIELP